MHGFSPVPLGLVLLAASLVAIVSRRLRLPYSVGLVLAGILLALAPVDAGIPLTRDLVFNILLPPLVFEGAMQMAWRDLRRDLLLIILFASLGLVLAALLVTAGLHGFFGWSWLGAGLFGVLIAATDPVAVLAAFKELKVERRLSVLVEAESLLNDGTAAVGFSLLLALAGGDAVTPLGVAGTLAWTILGGVLAGLVVTGGMLLLGRPSKDHMVEITLTTIAAYGSFLLAEHFHASGVLASLTAGLVVGNLGLVHTISPAGRGHVVAFWEYAAFLANSLVFILIGQQEAHHARDIATGLAGAAILLVLAGRVVAIYPLTALAARIPPRIGLARIGLARVGVARVGVARVGVARIGVARIEGRHAHVLFWGGLRGALGLALALALPDSVPERGKIIVLAFAVVAFSVFVQGLSMPWLLRRLGFLRQG